MTTAKQETETTAGAFQRWRALCSTCRQIFGMPDYDAYVAHASARHPDARVLTRDEYFAQAIERRYGGRGPGRCC